MAYYKSSEMIEKNVESWVKNLEGDTRRRRDIQIIDTLSCYTRLPKKNDIIGRYHTLLEHKSEKKARISIIAEEFIGLWGKFSFPILTKQTIISKLNKFIQEYEKNRKRKKESYEIEIESIFDITKEDGEWLCQEDKELYNLQIKSQGKIGFVTCKTAPKSSIHPSKIVDEKSVDELS